MDSVFNDDSMADDVFFDIPTPTSPLVGGSFNLSLNGALPRTDNLYSPMEAPPLPPKEGAALGLDLMQPHLGYGTGMSQAPPLPLRDYQDMRWATSNLDQSLDSSYKIWEYRSPETRHRWDPTYKCDNKSLDSSFNRWDPKSLESSYNKWEPKYLDSSHKWDPRSLESSYASYRWDPKFLDSSYSSYRSWNFKLVCLMFNVVVLCHTHTYTVFEWPN